MEQKVKPAARIEPLPPEHTPELRESFDAMKKNLGFLNRWNDTMGTPLEAEPIEIGEKYLAAHGWRVGKHAR